MGDRRDRERDRGRDAGPPERINSFFVVDTGFVEPDRNTCFEFQRTGTCSKGEACRFTHARPPGQGGAPGGAPGAGGGGSAKPWLNPGAATLVRGADGALELRPGGDAAAQPAAGDGGGGKKRKEKDDKKDKKERKKRKKEEKKRRKEAKRDKKDKKERKRRSRSASSSSSSSSSSGEAAPRRDAADAPPDASFPIAPIGEDDYFMKNHELSAWLRASRGVFFTSLTAVEARAAFRDFCTLWNTRQLPRRLYEGVQVSGRR